MQSQPFTTQHLQPCWIERKTATIIAKARRSQWRDSIFQNADQFIRYGYASDVALAMACDYWLPTVPGGKW
jgi:hypothetical protein